MTQPKSSEGKPTRTAGSASDRGQEAARQKPMVLQTMPSRLPSRRLYCGYVGRGRTNARAHPTDIPRPSNAHDRAGDRSAYAMACRRVSRFNVPADVVLRFVAS